MDKIEEIFLEFTKQFHFENNQQLHDTIYRLLVITEKYLKQSFEYLPIIERFLIDSLDAMFSPKQILKQAILIFAIQMTLIGLNTTNSFVSYLYQQISAHGRQEKKLLDELSQAKTYSDWKVAASKLDKFRGLDIWRHNPASSLYDYKLVMKRIAGTREMLDRGDVFDLMFRIRGALARDQFGIQNEGLFNRALTGSKNLVEQYHETMARALQFICDSPIADEEIPTDAKLAFFNETRHAYGRTAILLSGGAYLGYYHMGVVGALFQEGLLPRVMSGASAGSIMTAVIGTKTDQELQALLDSSKGDNLPIGLRTDFFRFSEELKSEMGRRLNYLVPHGLRWITHPILSSLFDKKILNLDTEHFKKCLMQNCGLYTFQEAFDRTGRIINIIVAPLNHYDPPRLLNYLTAPHVCVWSAAAASCAIPGIFDSITLIVKEPNGQFRPENEWTRSALFDSEEAKAAKMASYSDGSLENDLPMEQLSELFNVNHFIVSQVNPHSALLSSLSFKQRPNTSIFYNALVGYMRFLSAQCRDWLKNIINFFMFRSNAPTWSAKRGISQTLTQDYEGRENDITIMPWAGHVSTITALCSAIKNPNGFEYNDIFHAAAANTWPTIARIRAHCLIEMTLDQCVQRLRKRITEESQVQHERVIKNVLKQVANSTGRPQQLDRTPSFYTSRSIVNLSGLSVSDPVPFAKRRPSHGTITATPSAATTPANRVRSRSSSIGADQAITNTVTNGAEPALQPPAFPAVAPPAATYTVNVSAGQLPPVVPSLSTTSIPYTKNQSIPTSTVSNLFDKVNSNENLASGQRKYRSGSFSYHLEDLSEDEDEHHPQLVTFEVIQQVPLERTNSIPISSTLPSGPLHTSISSEEI